MHFAYHKSVQQVEVEGGVEVEGEVEVEVGGEVVVRGQILGEVEGGGGGQILGEVEVEVGGQILGEKCSAKRSRSKRATQHYKQ